MHWGEPAPATDRSTLRIRNEEHIVTGGHRLLGGEWTRHAIRYETSGYDANTTGDLLSLRAQPSTRPVRAARDSVTSGNVRCPTDAQVTRGSMTGVRCANRVIREHEGPEREEPSLSDRPYLDQFYRWRRQRP